MYVCPFVPCEILIECASTFSNISVGGLEKEIIKDIVKVEKEIVKDVGKAEKEIVKDVVSV